MTKQKPNPNANLYDLIKIIKEASDSEVVIVFDKKSELYRNASNLQILRKVADINNKNVTFEVENEEHKDFIESVNNDTIDYTDAEVSLDMEDEAEDHEEVVEAIKATPAKASFFSRFKGNGKSRWYINYIIKPLIFILAIFGVLFSLWWFIPSAQVDITVDSEVLVKLLNFKASTETSIVSVEDKTIPAVEIGTTETDSQTIPVTGEKETGEKAEGELTLVNKTDDEIEIDKGTIVKLISTDKEGLRYEIKDDVKVPASEEKTTESETGDSETTETVYGKKSVKIEATVYGDEYNIDKGEKFEVSGEDTDDLVGENEEDINGGSEETIAVVTQEDLDSLERSLEDFMKQKVADSISKKTVSGQSMQESTIKYEVSSAEFNKELDDEAEDLTLTMTVKGSALAYDEEDLDVVVVELTKTVIPEEYDMNEENPEYEVAATPSSNPEEIDIQVKIRSFITPKLDEEKIREDLSGMKLSQAQEYLDTVPNVKQFTITVTPRLPGPLMTLPQRAENIEVTIEK